ncbi:MAG: ATP-binding protein [Prevotellaceae bacterium]|jgi:SpoVK/Ycf46/Vps4 family AAA+-type ATPase|nr:ATP-binding protein [Prevotellaceae bacterium]
MRQSKVIQNKEVAALPVTKRRCKTLLQHIEYVIELAEDSKLSEDFYKKAKTSIQFIARKMKLSPNQAVIFSLFMEKSDDSRIFVSEFSRFLGCKNIKTISMMTDVDELEKRHLVRCRMDDGRKSYRVPIEVVEAVKQSIAYEYDPEINRNLTAEQLFQQMERLFDENENKEISGKTLTEELRSLIEDNASLAFCRRMREWNNIYDSDDNCLLLLLFCHRFINLDDDNVGFHDFEDLYERKWEFRHIKSSLQNGTNDLIEMKILEYQTIEGFANNEFYKISDRAKEQLFSELDVKIRQGENRKGLILHGNVAAKDLFYNKREQAQIIQLASLLQEDNFANVQKRLHDSGMRKGFACLFYGAPGTGKTETVYQIARSTGRDIMMVDIAETKSCWFGESEKKIKAIFDRYSAFVKTNKTVPILLFNEADAVIGKRRNVESGSVAQTENAIQNIILQEMENLDGIMIATTNLTQNLDKAFERRFLYKIEFEKPDVEAKKMIWLAMIPALSNREAEELAAAYDFSGGQIENIVRKRTIDSILSGIEPSLETMHGYCRNESLYKDGKRKIGF